MIKLVSFSFLCIFIEIIGGVQEVYPFVTALNCSKSEHYDIAAYKCSSCSSGFEKSASGFSCGCYGVNKYIKYVNSTINCLSCKATEYASKDRSVCVTRNCTNIGNGKITCSVCKKNQIAVTNSLNGSSISTVECITCAPGFTPSSDRTRCQPCSIKSSDNTKLCECDRRKFKLINDVCIPNAFMKNMSNFKPITASGEAFQSNFFDDNLIPSAYLCSLKNTMACQLLANMCVFALYTNIDNSPCKLWKKFKQQAPAIMYGEGESYSTLYRKKIDIAYSSNEGNQYNYVNIISLTMDAFGDNGQFIDDNSKWMLPCPVTKNEYGKDLFKFASNYKFKCTIGAKELFSRESLIFEPYIKYRDDNEKDGTPMLHSIPILIKGSLISFNKDNDVNTWQLVRRFYMFDKISGVSNANGKEALKYFRYVKYIQVKIRIRGKVKDVKNIIYTPLIVLNYGELNDDDINRNVDVDIKFDLTYELDAANMVNGMEIAVGSISAFAVLYTILQTWSHSRRSGRLGFDPYIIVQFFIYAAGNLANTFFIVSFGASCYSFLIYKLQKVIYILPPTDKDESVIKTYIIVAFSLKIIEVLAMNWRQINVDLSFIDWERTAQPLLEIGIRTPSKSNLKADTSVSFWRSYFVANEWNEIQTIRKISLPLHLICYILFVEIFGVSRWADVGINVDSGISQEFIVSPAYRMASNSLIYLLLYFSQLILSMLLYERYVKNVVLDFMDVCSIANVSILILDKPLHGYYLHGRCIHASCDADVRGLQPGLPHRAFSVRCTPEFRLYFDRLNTHMLIKGVKWQWQHHLSYTNEKFNTNSSTTGLNSARKSSARSSRRDENEMNGGNEFSSILEHREQAAKLINKFLTAFLDHALEDLDYEVRETRFIERLLDMELMEEGNYKSIFLYNDGDSQSFQRIIWYGQEWTLATFDLYLFSLIHVTIGNHVISALVTVVIWMFLSICRQYGGKRNLSRKTLVDERFLI